MDKISINIWDDFYEDGQLPVGKIQETYAYVDSADIPEDIIHKSLEILLNYIKTNIKLAGVKMFLEYHDTKNDYDEETVKRCIDTYGEKFFFKRWELKFKHLTHEQLDMLIEKLEKLKLSYNGIPFDIYSES